VVSPLEMAILTHKLKTRRITDPTDADTGKNFEPRVQPAPDPKFRGCGCVFLFQFAGDPHPTQNLVYYLSCENYRDTIVII
jgi:hypothetical protein